MTGLVARTAIAPAALAPRSEPASTTGEPIRHQHIFPVPMALGPEGAAQLLREEYAAWGAKLARDGLEIVGDVTTSVFSTPDSPFAWTAKLEAPVARVFSPYDDQGELRSIADLNGPPTCDRVCSYAVDVGMAEHSIDPQRAGGCGNCGHYFAPLMWEGDQA